MAGAATGALALADHALLAHEASAQHAQLDDKAAYLREREVSMAERWSWSSTCTVSRVCCRTGRVNDDDEGAEHASCRGRVIWQLCDAPSRPLTS